MNKTTIVLVLSAASAWGQFSKVRGESEFAVNAAGKASLQQYFWEDFKGSNAFLMQRAFLVEGGAKLLETGVGYKFTTPILKSVTVAYSTDGFLVTPFVFGGTVIGRRLTFIADHKGTIGKRPGFTFTKLYYPLCSYVIVRAEGTFLDDSANNPRKKGNWTSLQPGIELRGPFNKTQNAFWVVEYDVKNRGLVWRMGLRL